MPGFIKKLGRPNHLCDPKELGDILFEPGIASFRIRAMLRPQSEILDEAGLIYWYHWATTDACIHGQPMPADLRTSVIYERHYALNWLIGYQNQDWDDITTDT